MEPYIDTVLFSNQDAFIRTHGDKIWEGLCDGVPDDGFTVASAAARVPYLLRFDPGMREKYLRLILRNVEMQPDEPPVYRVGGKHGRYWNWTQPDF